MRPCGIDQQKDYILQNINNYDDSLIEAIYTLVYAYNSRREVNIMVGESEWEKRDRNKIFEKRRLSMEKKKIKIRNEILKKLEI